VSDADNLLLMVYFVQQRENGIIRRFNIMIGNSSRIYVTSFLFQLHFPSLPYALLYMLLTRTVQPNKGKMDIDSEILPVLLDITLQVYLCT